MNNTVTYELKVSTKLKGIKKQDEQRHKLFARKLRLSFFLAEVIIFS